MELNIECHIFVISKEVVPHDEKLGLKIFVPRVPNMPKTLIFQRLSKVEHVPNLPNVNDSNGLRT